MTSSNRNIFCIIGPLWVESTAHRRIPLTKGSARNLIFFFDLCLNKRLSKQSRRRWFETPSRSPWRHYNDSRLKWCILSHHIVTQRSISSMTLTINTTRHILPTENRITNIELKEWISNYIIYAKLWDVISHACRYFNGELNHDYLEILGRETTGIIRPLI